MSNHSFPRRLAFVGLTMLALCVITARPAVAQFGLGLGGVVFDPKNLAQSVANYKKLVDQLNKQTQLYTSHVTALRKLASLPTRDVQNTLTAIDAAMRQGQALGYSLANVDALFQQTFPEITIAEFSDAANQSRTGRTLATLRSALDAARRTANTIPEGLTRLQHMKTQLGQAVGHQQALEVNGAASVYAAEELVMLRQQLAAQTNAHAVYYASEISRRRQAEANDRAFVAWLAQPPQSTPRTVSFRPGRE